MYKVGDKVRVIKHGSETKALSEDSPIGRTGVVSAVGVGFAGIYVRVAVDDYRKNAMGNDWLLLNSEIEPLRSVYAIGDTVNTPYGIARIVLLAAHPERQQWSLMVKTINSGSLYPLRDNEVSPVNNVELWV